MFRLSEQKLRRQLVSFNKQDELPVDANDGKATRASKSSS